MATASSDQSSAVVLVWERVGEEDPGGLSARDFEAQIRELERGGYTPVPLSDVASAVRTGHPLPALAVSLTFDGGRDSLLKAVVPFLLNRRIPFTIFFSSDKADRGDQGYLDWTALRTLAKNPLVTLGVHPAVYTRLDPSESQEISRQINKARARYREEIGTEPAFFAYPFGDVSGAYLAQVERQNFRGAFGAQFGVADASSDPYLIPRFSVTGGYGDIDQFQMIAGSLPLPVRNVAPEDPLLTENPPRIGFSVALPEGEALERLSCSSSGQGRPKIEILSANRVELRFTQPFDESQVRVICTLPSALSDRNGNPRWRWLGFLWSVPEHLLP